MLKRFKVIIEEEPSEGGFSVFIPALPGCSSQAESVSGALLNIKEAAELYIEGLREDGLPLPSSDIEIIVEDIEVAV